MKTLYTDDEDVSRVFAPEEPAPALAPGVEYASLSTPDVALVTEAYTDGGCRGNPGPAGYGVFIRHRGDVVALKGTVLKATNNEAEYLGLLACLRWAQAQRAVPLIVHMDSELVIRQMQGRYSVGAKLRAYYLEACTLVRDLQQVTFVHVHREYNHEADRLANEAMDEAGFPRETRWSKGTNSSRPFNPPRRP